MTGRNAQPGDKQLIGPAAEWREDLDALQFPVPGHDAHCLVHRLAFRAIVSASKQTRPAIPDPAACLALFFRETAAFHAAAQAKILRQAIPTGKNLHLNSRDIRRALTDLNDAGGAKAKACRVLGG